MLNVETIDKQCQSTDAFSRSFYWLVDYLIYLFRYIHVNFFSLIYFATNDACHKYGWNVHSSNFRYILTLNTIHNNDIEQWQNIFHVFHKTNLCPVASLFYTYTVHVGFIFGFIRLCPVSITILEPVLFFKMRCLFCSVWWIIYNEEREKILI